MSSDGLPLVMTVAGPVPTPPATIRSALLSSVAAVTPGYTGDLPGSLIEDIASTDVGAITLIDQARVNSVNDVSPLGANPFLLAQLGQMYGVPQGQQTNTSVYVQFSGATSQAGFIIAQGFIVSDGTYQYTIPDGGVIRSDGTSDLLYAVAIVSGSWVVPVSTVTTLVTSLPSTISLTVTNPAAGLTGQGSETQASYRAAVLQAGLATTQGTARYLKTLLGNVPGVQRRLVSARQVGQNFEILVGGGDPYQVAYAIFMSFFGINVLVGSTINITEITNATLGVVTTGVDHGLTNGQSNVYIAGVQGMTGANGGPYTVAVLNDTQFTFGVNTSGFGMYTSGGVVTPNARNVTVSLNDYPDTYLIPFVVPLQQVVTMTVTWKSDSPNYISATSIAQAASPAITNYVNTIPVGQPINLLVATSVFQAAVQSILPVELLSSLVFSISIDGTVTAPSAGTDLVYGDAESYLFALSTGIVVVQG